jgi:Zn-dependent protease with chaperone function
VTALLLLGGFYVYALAIAGGVAVGTGWLVWKMGGGALSAKLVVIGGGISLAVVIALFRALRHRPAPPEGVRLSREDAPGLWAMAESAAAEAGTRGPDEILLDPDFNAGVTEETRMLGLVGGRRYLVVGLPMLATFSTGQFRSVIGHEFGHYSHQHTRLGALTYRGHVSVAVMLDAFAERSKNPVTWLFRAYAELFFTVQGAVSRAQEFEADRIAVRVAGGENTRSAFRELPVMAEAWAWFLEQYAFLGADARLVPRDLMGGFGKFCEGRADAIAELRAAALPDKAHRHDTHPPIAQRIAVLEGAGGGPTPGDGAPATSLVSDFGALSRRLEDVWFAAGVERVEWEELVHRTVETVQREQADMAYRAVARVLGKESSSLEDFIVEVEAGRGDAFLHAVVEAGFPVDGLRAMLISAAIDSGALRVELRWDESAVFVTPDGELFDLDELAVPLLESGADVSGYRELLAKRGVDLALGVPSGETTSASMAAGRAELVAAVNMVKLNGRSQHMFVATTGLVFLPFKWRPVPGRWTLNKILKQHGEVDALIAAADLWLPFEELMAVEWHKGLHFKATFTTHDGTEYKLVEKASDQDRLGEPFEALGQVAAQLIQK